MVSKSKLATGVVVAGFVALLAWSTLEEQRAECRVCMRFEGRENCATAAAASEGEAAHSAQMTACATISSGINQSMACQRAEPSSKSCSSR